MALKSALTQRGKGRKKCSDSWGDWGWTHHDSHGGDLHGKSGDDLHGSQGWWRQEWNEKRIPQLLGRIQKLAKKHKSHVLVKKRPVMKSIWKKCQNRHQTEEKLNAKQTSFSFLEWNPCTPNVPKTFENLTKTLRKHVFGLPPLLALSPHGGFCKPKHGSHREKCLTT